MWKEFKPAIRFVLWFVGLYFLGNIIYGIYISYCGNSPDNITILVTKQTAWLLQVMGYPVQALANVTLPTVSLRSGSTAVLDVYEGCNGVNIFIVFVAFVVAFGGSQKNLWWFLPLGLTVLHISNLARIALLFWTAMAYQNYFYYVHKYFFTIFLYAMVFLLWIIWINKFNGRKKIIAD